MATGKGQRIAAFTLAMFFLLTTVGTALYVLYEINKEDAGLVTELPLDETLQQQIQEQQQDQEEEEPVQEPTTIANFTGPVTIESLRFDDEVVGTGTEVQAGDTVTIHYTGARATDGFVFDSSVSRGQTAEFPLGSLIQGWQEGIPGMKVGGKRRLFIPAELGYGASGAGANIPPNTDLIFDIELFATKPSQ